LNEEEVNLFDKPKPATIIQEETIVKPIDKVSDIVQPNPAVVKPSAKAQVSEDLNKLADNITEQIIQSLLKNEISNSERIVPRKSVWNQPLNNNPNDSMSNNQPFIITLPRFNGFCYDLRLFKICYGRKKRKYHNDLRKGNFTEVT
jgi:hypothetical protein